MGEQVEKEQVEQEQVDQNQEELDQEELEQENKRNEPDWSQKSSLEELLENEDEMSEGMDVEDGEELEIQVNAQIGRNSDEDLPIRGKNRSNHSIKSSISQHSTHSNDDKIKSPKSLTNDKAYSEFLSCLNALKMGKDVEDEVKKGRKWRKTDNIQTERTKLPLKRNNFGNGR